MTMSTRAVIEAIFADAATGNLDDVLRWWHDDGVLEDVTIAKAFSGKPAIREYLEMYYRAIPTVDYVPIRTVIDGEEAVVEWAQHTAVERDFDGVPGVGQGLDLHAIDIFHVVDGLIVHEASWYGDGWLRQRLEHPEDVSLPPALPVTPPILPYGGRF
jgi:steroid delta-isomerase-like uncharacterized protein